jgi:hypothetical protein
MAEALDRDAGKHDAALTPGMIRLAELKVKR